MPWPPPPTSDVDGDGWSPPDDCDDGDAAVHPDAVDVPYNGVDEDCNDGDLTDVDADGHDADAVGGDDCNDATAQISPSAEELCDNGDDEDCDGEIDEACGAVADPGDPGGFAWACGTTPGAAVPWLGLLAAALILSRGRSATSRR
jgi:hypothetical protein